MSDSTFHADLDALVRGESVESNDELTRFVTDLYGEEQNVTMPNTLKLRIANDLGLAQANEPTTIPAPVSRRTLRAVETKQRSTRPWAIGLGIAAAVLLVLTAVLRWGMPIGNDQPDNHVLLATPAVPTVAVSPDATPSVAEFDWTTDVSAEECPVDELMNRGAWSDLLSEKAAGFDTSNVRQDAPYVRAETGDAEVVILRQRQAMACLSSQEMDALPIESSRRAWEFLVDAETNDALHADRVARSQEFSQWVETQFGLTPADLAHQVDDVPGPIWLSENAVEMADGRIALIPSWRTTADDITQRFGFYVPVWENVDGEWLLDEELFFCIGDCDDYWEKRASVFPDATPIASPETGVDWLQPISAEECTTEDIDQLPDTLPEEFDAFPPRQYNLVGPADLVDANVAIAVARQYQACDRPTSMLSDRSAIEAAITGESFSPTMIVMLDRQMVDGIYLSAQLEEQGITASELLDSPAAQPEDSGDYQLPRPDLVFTLADGRMVVVTVTGSSSPPGAIGTALSLTYENGAWKIDENIPVCIGECDRVFSRIETIYTDAVWLMPISTEECLEQHYLPADISEDDAAAFKSRQYRACETDGGAESMQGTDFHVIEGEDARPLSDEIAALHRQNGETPGSLQRIAPEAFWNETESVVEIQEESWTAFQPTSVVTLNDGRIAVLESTVITSDGVSNSGRTSPVVTTALVWIVDEGTWLLDEEVTVCLGNCDSF